MGRRPNTLLATFFDRGSKLDDQSNRYVQTCKKCHLVFPKGRADALHRHLFEQCPNITQQDREIALWHASDVSTAQTSDGDHGIAALAAFNSAQGHSVTSFASEHETTALDTLAEVSRQQRDLVQSNSDFARGAAHAPDTEGSLGINEVDKWYAQLQQQLESVDTIGADLVVPVPVHATHLNDVPGTRQPSELVQSTNADLNALLFNEPSNTSLLNAGHGSTSCQAQAIDPELHVGQTEASTVGQKRSHEAMRNGAEDVELDTLEQDEPRAFGLLQKTSRKSARTRFSDERRRQVGGVRKLGACIRCRMLKKPCSEGTPCKTCSTVESARLWKTSCIRTRFIDEFTLFSTAFFNAKSHAKVNALLVDRHLQKQPGRIQATLFPDTQIHASFNPMATLEPSQDPEVPAHLVTGLLMIDFEGDQVTAKMEKYLVDMTNEFVEHETSQIIKATMKTATRLISTHGDILLAKSINLWVATQVLTVQDDTRWSLSYNSDAPSLDEPETMEPGLHAILPESVDYDLIRAQLLDACERYCSKQSKAVLNELERRVIARQQTSPFLTFLISVITLNCVERMARLYRGFDTTDGHLQPGGENPDVPDASGVSYVDWPLATSPTLLWKQGQTFSNLLCNVLRLRGLPPRICVREDNAGGMLKVQRGKLQANLGQGSEEPDSQLLLAAQWLIDTGLTMADLHAANAVDDSLSTDLRAWDLKFIIGMIWPDAIDTGEDMG